MKNNVGKKIVGGIIGFIILILIFSGFYVVQPGQVAFEKTVGNIDNNIVGEGLYFKLPITSTIKYNTKNIVVTTDSMSASKDLQDITTTIAVNFGIRKSKVIDLYRTVGDEHDIQEKIVNKAVQEAVKASTAKFTASECITSRTEVRDMIIINLKTKLEERGLDINQVDILNFKFSEQFNKSIELKVKAEQDALTAKALVAKVKYESESKIARAEGEAKAVEINAIAEAQAIKIKAQSIQNQGGADFIKLQWINAWDGKLPTTSLGEGNGMILNLK